MAEEFFNGRFRRPCSLPEYCHCGNLREWQIAIPSETRLPMCKWEGEFWSKVSPAKLLARICRAFLLTFSQSDYRPTFPRWSRQKPAGKFQLLNGYSPTSPIWERIIGRDRTKYSKPTPMRANRSLLFGPRPGQLESNAVPIRRSEWFLSCRKNCPCRRHEACS